MNAFRAIRQSARDWWYHRELRAQGQHEEATKREHRSCRDSVKTLRTALKSGGFLSIGRGGVTLYVDANTRVEGYCADSGDALAARLMGIPWVDTTTVPDEDAFGLVNLPMAKPGLEKREGFCGLDGIGAAMAQGFGLAGVLAAKQTVDPPGADKYGPMDYCPPAVYARMAAKMGATVGNWNGEI